MKKEFKPGTLLAPIPACLISCGSMDKPNMFTAAWTGIICSEPAMTYVSIRPSRFSYSLIKENMSFCINLVSESLTYAADWCGVKSGRDYDKFKEMKLHAEASPKLGCPMVSESPVTLECRVTEIKPLGSHDMFMAEITGVYVSDGLIDKNGRIDFKKADLMAYSHGEFYQLGKKIGKFGYSVRKKKNIPGKSKLKNETKK